MKRSFFTRGILTLSVTVALVAIPVSSASADRTLNPASVDFGSRQVGTTSPAQTHQLSVVCGVAQEAPLVCFLIALAGGDPFTPSVSVTGEFAQTNDCLATLFGSSLTPQTCTIQTTFTPTSPGPKEGVLSTGPDGPTATLTGVGVTTPTPPTPPQPGGPSPPAPPPTLDLAAKKQELKKGKLAFFATTNVATSLVAGGSVKPTTKQLAAGVKTKVKAKVKSSVLRKLNKSGKAKAIVDVAATNQAGSTASRRLKVKLTG